MSKRIIRWAAKIGLGIVTTAILLQPSTAEARRRGIVLLTHGDKIATIGEVVDGAKESVRAATGAEPDVGYIYSAIGVFWLDLWTWDGRYCLAQGDQYWELDEEQAAALLGREPGGVRKPLQFSFPPGLILLGIIAIGFAVRKAAQGNRARKLEVLFNDDRYQRALQILQDECKTEVDGEDPDARGARAMDRAVAFLSGQGIARNEASENLSNLVGVLQAQRA